MDPIATYRLQLHSDFDFDEAAALTGYLAELGISHLYLSPILQAAPGSTHGYDIVDPTRVNAELGGEAGFDRLTAAADAAGLRLVLDIVPNHMAIGGPSNPWWWDVLENGPASRWAPFFDVDWESVEHESANKILLPVLGDHYGRVLEAGELRLVRIGGDFQLHYHDHRFPVAPRSLSKLLATAGDRCSSALLGFMTDSHGRLPPPGVRNLALLERRHRDKEVLRQMRTDLMERDPAIADEVDRVIDEHNKDPDALDDLIASQNYRLAYWRMAEHELGYRRFFDINSLICLRVEDETVFAETHRLILDWLKQGRLAGVRIDHPDGLRDPEGYLRRLRSAAPGAWIVVEKILEYGEALPPNWPVDGTTGYDFLNLVNGLFVDPASEQALTEFYTEFTGESADFEIVVREKKRQVLRDVLGSDVYRLSSLLRDICARHRQHHDYTRSQLESAVTETVACFPVYRTYVQDDPPRISEDDARYIATALEAAQQNVELDPKLFEFLRDLLLLRIQGDEETEFAMRFQQLTGPAMAKGLEDTAFYCFNRFVALNEVGGSPQRFGRSMVEFHADSSRACSEQPRRMLASSTHDTKRSEDVRSRLAVLSEIPEAWCTAVRRWSDMNAGYKTNDWPDRNAEYLFYQTLVGAWPLDVRRATAFMQKAAREAKQYTSWTHPNETYEQALEQFVEATLADEAFIRDVEALVSPLMEWGQINSLSHTLLKLTAPGVPDVYQGTELWDLSLVDPDNRRPVDYAQRREWLHAIRDATADEVYRMTEEGASKLWLIQRLLAFRQRHPDIFSEGDYQPLYAKGRRSENVISFVRRGRAITVVPRLVSQFKLSWDDTRLELPSGKWCNFLTLEEHSGTVGLSPLLARFPVALLVSDES